MACSLGLTNPLTVSGPKLRLKLGRLEFEPDKLTLRLVSLALEMDCETKAEYDIDDALGPS
ncbi:hypothetical protein [Shewanella benthica]|uniref:Uncharacterized protein n=1 Tax=Shewanella benthica KT99 TaxID=314608 RepID=A9EKL9_9GAMM|nr:hypothetical protein [Shewanella benthica]EDP99494.1 hypothetical protein KT99_11525 [Shewanella benthica KT99]